MKKEKSPRERFKEIAPKRVNKVISAMISLQKCSNKYSYEYNEDEVKKMIQALKEKFEELKKSFEKGVKKEEKIFKF